LSPFQNAATDAAAIAAHDLVSVTLQAVRRLGSHYLCPPEGCGHDDFCRLPDVIDRPT
jgi:hypothetical protein